MTADEPEHLAGNVGGAWRIGDTVHRPTGPWTPAVHALLDFLTPRIPCVPRVLGFDDEGREVLTYLPGDVYGDDEDVLTDGQLCSLVTWTRTFHQAAATFSHPGPWRLPRLPHATLIAHSDLAPCNVCFDGDRLVGVFDWDIAGPTTPLLELGWIAWSAAPLWRDVGAVRAADRVTLIAETYGGIRPSDVLGAVPVRVQRMLDTVTSGAAAGDPGMVNLMAHGEPGRSRGELDRLCRRLPEIEAHLR